ncbi:hypothetical protein BJ944DRAFT_242439 [Cunninghamella echinulata]|nr:hypothetical protein BJ944DRAFT_242439 [Cunninghamella echinulata]
MAPYNRRRNITNNQGDRIITIGGISGGSGGLNERFGRIDQQTRHTAKSPVKNNTSVFSRLNSGPKSQVRGGGIQSRLSGGSIQNRLGVQRKSGNKQAAVTKKQAPTKFIKKSSASSFGKNKQNNNNKLSQKGGKFNNNNNNQKNKSQKQQQKNKKPLSAEALDKALDSYMMKDPKTAQAKLDAELNSYMDDAPMDDDLMALN